MSIIKEVIENADLPEEIKDFLLDGKYKAEEKLQEIENKISGLDIETIKLAIDCRFSPLWEINKDYIEELDIWEAFKFEDENDLTDLDMRRCSYWDLSREYESYISNQLDHGLVDKYISSLIEQEHYDAIELMESF